MSFARVLLAAVALAGLTLPAQAQYPYEYDETPRPYYDGPPRGYRGEPPPGYREPPPRFARDLGQRCRVRLRTDIGRTRYVCPIVRARPVGRPCVCPPPRGYGPGPYLDGVVIN